MFHMMNEARVAVGAGAVALGYTGYLKSLDYARTRTQGRPPGAKDPSAPPVPLVEHADVRRMLLAQKAFVEGGLGLVLYCGKLLDEERTAETPEARAHAHLMLDVLTPIAKSWPSQYCLQANDLAIQVYGGYGYTREYDVEQHYRDNRLNPIHEGTHGIQALDLLGRKVVMADGAGLTALADAVRLTVAEALAAGGEAADLGAELDDALTRLVDATAIIHAADLHPAARLANASVYLEAAGHVVVAWVWLGQFLATGDREDPFHQGKRQAARYFYRFELPQTGPKLDLLARLDPTTYETDPGWL
jgi:butyryl-CoA dehydrogenase